MLCDDCLTIARPWERGRAALLYRDNGRKLVLALKHGDRMDLARPAADWMVRAARPLFAPGMVVAPVPLHWLRLFTRRYNQAALLSAAIARSADLAISPTCCCATATPAARKAATATGVSATSTGRCACIPATTRPSQAARCCWSMT